jgi:hypothetical protein
MKLTATPAFLALAHGSGMVLSFRTFIRKTTNISLALDSGSWLEITDRVEWSSYPAGQSQIEYETGQFTSQEIKLKGVGIQYFKNNVLNATDNEYIECKIEFSIVGATDIIYHFSGFIDKVGPNPKELTDTIEFSVFSGDDLGKRISAERVCCQPINHDIDGSGTFGLVLQNIPSLYVIDANVESFILSPGVHTIKYEITGGVKYASLDNGVKVALTSDDQTLTLGNGDTAAIDPQKQSLDQLDDAQNDTQKLTVYVRSLAGLPAANVEDAVIVTNEGDTLPRQWYRNILAKPLLKKLYHEIGIDTTVFDMMEMTIVPGDNPVVFYDLPPNNIDIDGITRALTNDGQDLYMAVDNIIFKRIVDTGEYIELARIDSGFHPEKLLYNARNNHLWIYAGNVIYRLELDTNTLSAQIEICVASESVWRHAIELVDYNYVGSSWKYGIIFTDVEASDVSFIDGTTLAQSFLGFFANESQFLFLKDDHTVWYKVFTGSDHQYYEIAIDGAGAFISNGVKGTSMPSYTRAAYDPISARVVYWDISGGGKVRSHLLDDGSTFITHLDPAPSVDFIYYANGRSYFCTSGVSYIKTIYSVIPPDAAQSIGIRARAECTGLTYTDRLYGINAPLEVGAIRVRELFQCDVKMPFLIPLAYFTQTCISDGIKKIFQAFNLVGFISASKRALIYRRGDNDGTPVTSGNKILITINEPSNIEEIICRYPRIGIIQVANGNRTVTYDGTKFYTSKLSEVKSIQISNDFIPDWLLRTLTYRMFNFFKVDRSLRKIICGVLPLFQYEPLDEAEIVLTGTQIVITGSAPIYEGIYDKDGSLTLGVLL